VRRGGHYDGDLAGSIAMRRLADKRYKSVAEGGGGAAPWKRAARAAPPQRREENPPLGVSNSVPSCGRGAQAGHVMRELSRIMVVQNYGFYSKSGSHNSGQLCRCLPSTAPPSFSKRSACARVASVPSAAVQRTLNGPETTSRWRDARARAAESRFRQEP